MAIASGTLALVINQPLYPMQEYLVFHHPLGLWAVDTSQRNEQYRNILWGGTFDQTAGVSGMVGDGWELLTGYSNQNIRTPSIDYKVIPSGDFSLVLTYWVYGDGLFQIGWNTTEMSTLKDGFYLSHHHNYLEGRLYRDGIYAEEFSIVSNTVDPSFWTTGWHFVSIITEQSGSQRRIYGAIDNTVFNNPAWYSRLIPSGNQGTYLTIQAATPANQRIDEATLWYVPRGTMRQAQRDAIYQLELAGSGIRQYYDAYGFGYQAHYDAASGINLFVSAGYSWAQHDLYIKGGSGYLHEDDVAFHFRMDKNPPYDPGHQRTGLMGWNDGYLVPMKFASGMRYDTDSSANFAFPPMGASNDTLDGRDFIAGAVWISGLQAPGNAYWSKIFLGYMSETYDSETDTHLFGLIDGAELEFNPDVGIAVTIWANELGTWLGYSWPEWSWEVESDTLLFFQAYYVYTDGEWGPMWQAFMSINGRPFEAMGDPVPATDIAWFGSLGGVNWRGVRIAQDPLNSFVVGESCLWTSFSDPFDDVDAGRLYRLYENHGAPMDEFGVYYTDPDAAIALYTAGPIPMSGSCDLVLQAKSQYLHHSDVMFYHPCESGAVEHIKNLTWNSYQLQDLVSRMRPAQVGSGYYHVSTESQWAQSPSGNYASCSGDSSWTFAFWASGSFPTDGTREFYIGWGGVSNSPFVNHMAYGYKWNSNQAYVSVGTQNASDQDFLIAADASTNVSTPRLIVMRVEFHDGSGYPMVSQNGRPWLTATQKAIGLPDNQGAYIGFGNLNGYSSTFTLDEIIGWHNNARFTDQELTNLYLLGSGHLPMDIYSETFGTTASGSIDLYTRGVGVASGYAPFYIKAGIEERQCDLYLNSRGLASGSFGLYENARATAYQSGYLNITGAYGSTSGIDLFLENKYIGRDCALTLMANYQEASLFIRGITATYLFAKVSDNTESIDLNCTIFGVDGPTTNFTSNTIEMYVAVGDGYSSISGTWGGFAKTTNFAMSESGSWGLFLRNADLFNSCLMSSTLYLEAGRQTDIGLFIQGSGDSYYDGFTPLVSYGNVFAKVGPGNVLSVDMWVSGWYGEGSGYMPLHLQSYQESTADLDLYMEIVPRCSGWCILYVPSPIGVVSGIYPSLYVHGY